MRRVWIDGILIVSLLAVVVFAGGFGYALVDQAWLAEEPAEEIPGQEAPMREVVRLPLMPLDGVAMDVPDSVDGDAYRLVALGDSLTRGMGSGDGEGYLPYVEASYPEEAPLDLTIVNGAVNGHRTNDVTNDLNDAGLNGHVQEADMIVMTVGGNDLFQSGQGFFSQDLDQFTEAAKEEFIDDLDDLYAVLTRLNPDADIFHMGIYNPFKEFDFTNETNRFVREWNNATSELAADYEQVIFVPVADVFERDVSDLLFRDFFHPNDAGYERMAERLLTSLRWPEGSED
ncbi:GDSL-type esterase/lipase family protein [Salisediminibacterium beveridgei]|uniref:Lipase/Acylhydrolase with GDSL-like motif n=1 Tax=Salisediminibacterium beveridgei TaxID=632773 RepID=A0A1D7QS42_9BACI|nr:GDSL-type esterase/lipase family protein [Salisediminibacterium beveridgei]AOM81811.1 Lipase/Acylhydrolase with GDSL-like motif [Salisediminibacterium beveridgei]